MSKDECYKIKNNNNMQLREKESIYSKKMKTRICCTRVEKITRIERKLNQLSSSFNYYTI